MNTTPTLKEVPVKAVRIMIGRKRPEEGFERLKASMKAEGLKMPIQVRDKGRADENGIRYELICGQGRLTAAKQLRWETIPALVIEANEMQFAGLFLAENMIRKPLPWAQKGRMIKEQMALGRTLEEVAKEFNISEHHAQKYVRVITKTASGLEDEVAALPMNDAEVFTTLPPRDQAIVFAVAKKKDKPLMDVVQHAREISEKKKAGGEELTEKQLVRAVDKLDDTQKKQQARTNLKRLHDGLGPTIFFGLLAEVQGFKSALAAKGIDIPKESTL